MSGQMNVLFTEAGVPYDYVIEMDEIDDDFNHISYDYYFNLGLNMKVNIEYMLFASRTYGSGALGVIKFWW